MVHGGKQKVIMITACLLYAAYSMQPLLFSTSKSNTLTFIVGI